MKICGKPGGCILSAEKRRRYTKQSGVEPPHSKMSLLRLWRDLKVGGARDNLVREIILHLNFEGVVARSKSRQRQAAIQCDLLAVTADRAGTFSRRPYLLMVAKKAIGDGEAGRAQNVIS